MLLLKHWWMLFWRLNVVFLFLGIDPVLRIVITAVLAAAGAYCIVQVININVQIWPIIRLIMRKPAYLQLDPSLHPSPLGTGRSASHTRGRPQPQPQPEGASNTNSGHDGRRDRASRPGHMTGFEPKILKMYRAPISVNAKGVAGLGLFESDFSKASVYSGQLGETNFYKALCREGMIDHFSSYWSVAMPRDDGFAQADPNFSTDIDCIIVHGGDILLIDLKYYASGDVTWLAEDENTLICRDNATGRQVGKPRRMSKNMRMADERFPRIFPHHNVRSVVVLIPTNAGIGDVAPGTVWPGGIPLLGLPAMLDHLRWLAPEFADAETDQKLSDLLKA